MSRNRNLRIYENAVPLADAWLKLAAPDRRAEFEQTSGLMEAISKQPAPKSVADVITSTKAILASAQSHQRGRSELQEDLLDRLFNNDLVALGKRERPTKGYYPVTIDPSDFDYGEADWKRSTFSWAGRFYSDVRVYDPNADGTLGSDKRRGSMDSVDRAIRELKAANPKFGKLPKQQAHEQIWEKLGQTYEKGNGLSPQNLSKRIVAICGKRAVSKK